MSALAIQPPLISVKRTRALISLAMAECELVDYHEDQVLALMWTFHLGPAWNLASREAKRGEYRVLMTCVEQYKATGKKPVPPNEAQLLRIILPHTKPFITGQELQGAFNCKSTHLINLISEGLLKTVPGSSWRPGRGGSPVITRESVIQFLTERQAI